MNPNITHLLIALPTPQEKMRGVHATTLPYGGITSIRVHRDVLDALDLMVLRFNGTMSRNEIIAQLLNNAVNAYNAAYDEYVVKLKAE